MVKFMILLTRRDGVDREAFARWWLDRHRPLAERLPGLRRHEFNLLPEGAPIDAVVEQWFESEAAALAAYGSAEGREVAADSLNNVSARQRFAVEAHPFEVPAV